MTFQQSTILSNIKWDVVSGVASRERYDENIARFIDGQRLSAEDFIDRISNMTINLNSDSRTNNGVIFLYPRFQDKGAGNEQLTEAVVYDKSDLNTVLDIFGAIYTYYQQSLIKNPSEFGEFSEYIQYEVGNEYIIVQNSKLYDTLSKTIFGSLIEVETGVYYINLID